MFLKKLPYFVPPYCRCLITRIEYCEQETTYFAVGAVKHYHRPVKRTQYNSSSLQHPLLAPTLDLGDCYNLQVEGF